MKPQTLPTWGIVTTVKAPLEQILDFAAWHLDQGAHRIYIHLDDPDPETRAVLKAHPKIRVTPTGAAYWRQLTGNRPAKHQSRQTANATRILAKIPPEVDWLLHIDVDEFVLSPQPLAELLAPLPDTAQVARIRPAEVLAHDGPDAGPRRWLKACAANRAVRREQTGRIFPTYGIGLDGGFLSHVAGKILVRTALAGWSFRIHNVIRDGVENPGQVELSEATLAHMHAPDPETWLAHYRFRLERGSYRAELRRNGADAGPGMTTHALLAALEDEGGEDALRAFYRDVCTATPKLRAALDAEGLLRMADLDFAAARARHFP